jgi:hypothetical protein
MKVPVPAVRTLLPRLASPFFVRDHLLSAASGLDNHVDGRFLQVIAKKMQQADGSLGHSLELTGAVCPPWIISRTCEALKQSGVKSVDAR